MPRPIASYGRDRTCCWHRPACGCASKGCVRRWMELRWPTRQRLRAQTQVQAYNRLINNNNVFTVLDYFVGILGGLPNPFAAVGGAGGAIVSAARRGDEYETSRRVAQADVEVAQQAARQRAPGQSRHLRSGRSPAFQMEQAEVVLDFLATRFTSSELYDWMASVLRDVYRYFLREATSIARTAQQQLAFERQESVPAFIRSDYWIGESEMTGRVTDRQDRRGLVTCRATTAGPLRNGPVCVPVKSTKAAGSAHYLAGSA